MPGPRWIDAQRLRSRLTWAGLVEALIAGHRGARPEVRRVYLPDGSHGYLVWSALLPGEVAVTKMVTVIPGNPHGPAVQAVVAVHDMTSGAVLALLDGTELTYWKTAAASAMAATYLAPPHPTTMLMVGAGDLAGYLVGAHRAIRPSIDRLLVWNRTPAKAQRLAVELGGEAVEDLAAACGEATLISCATSTTTPVVRGEWLSPGTHVDLVGGFTPTMREADDDAVRRASLFVDHPLTIDDAGDICQPIADAVIHRDQISSDLWGLAGGEHPGRSSAAEITMFKSAGGGHLDLFAARHAIRVAGE